MQVTRTSMLTGITRTRDISSVSLTDEQMLERYQSWLNGELIQRAFPELSDDDREFLMTGITAEEWNNEFAGEEE